MLREYRLVGLMLICAAVAACGGGGSSAVLPTPTASCGSVSSFADASNSVTRALRADAQTTALNTTPVEAMIRSAQAGQLLSPYKSRADRFSPEPHRFTLTAPAAARSLLQTSSTTGRVGVPQKIGFARELLQTTTSASTAQHLDWQVTSTGGKVVAMSFSTEGARAVRLGVRAERIPVNATVRVYAQQGVSVFEVSGREILATLKGNVDADGDTSAAHLYWTPAVEGEEVTLEIELPWGVSSDDVGVAVPRLSHLFALPGVESMGATKALTSAQSAKRLGDAAFCEVDVSCDSSYSRESNATAKMSFVSSDGNTYVCTGTLLNDRKNTGTPYFLSANHCIGSQSEASTLATHWFYRSQSCNSTSTSASSRILTGGATLLYASSATDTSFMRLNEPPPAGALYAAWDPSIPVLATPVAGIHHPQGDLQKISYGTVKAYTACTALNPLTESFSCPASTAASSRFISTRWSRGVTEAGSSGSGLYKTIGSSKYFIGQLYGGSSTCIDPTATDSYGRFDVAYTAALSKWLDAGACP